MMIVSPSICVSICSAPSSILHKPNKSNNLHSIICELEASDMEASSSPYSSASSLTSERGVVFSTGSSFYRAQSSLGRDLAGLAAALYKRSQGHLRVLDAMSGCGVRALRYLVQSQADYVVANDCNPDLNKIIVENLQRYAPQGINAADNDTASPMEQTPGAGAACVSGTLTCPNHHTASVLCSAENSIKASNSVPGHSRDTIFPGTAPSIAQYGKDSMASACGPKSFDQTDRSLSNIMKVSNAAAGIVRGWEVRHEEVNRLLMRCHLDENFFDIIDIDSFGSDSWFIGTALSAIRYGGLIYLTCTDGFSAGGRRPYKALASYGAFIRQVPYSNELGLRMLLGGVVKEAALHKMIISPVFSVYAPHGPVFRVMIRVSAGKHDKIQHYQFISFCTVCGDSKTVRWEDLGAVKCTCSDKVSNSIKISGPLWTGPLHSSEDIKEMMALATEWGWIPSSSQGERDKTCSSAKTRQQEQDKLSQLLSLMLEESHPDLPFGYLDMDEIAKRGNICTPRRDVFIQALRDDGYVASRSQINPKAVKTNCPMSHCILLAQKLQGKL